MLPTIPAMLSALADLNAYKVTKGLTDPDLLVIGNLNGSDAMTNADLSALIGCSDLAVDRWPPCPNPRLFHPLPGLAFALCPSRRRLVAVRPVAVPIARANTVGRCHLLVGL